MADFRHSKVKGANFDGATIKDTLFDGAVLTGADFREADFTYIDNANRSQMFSMLAHGKHLRPVSVIDISKVGFPEVGPGQDGAVKQSIFNGCPVKISSLYFAMTEIDRKSVV